MAIINLRKHYYPFYTKDTFIEVPNEVAAVMQECRLYENRLDAGGDFIPWTGRIYQQKKKRLSVKFGSWRTTKRFSE